MKAEFSRSDLGEDRPHRGQAVDDRDLGVGILVLEFARDRARGKIVALADVGGDDQDLARLGLGVGLAGRDDHGLVVGLLRGLLARRQSTYLRTPSANGVAAVQPSSWRARSEDTILPPKSPGRAGV